MTSQKRSSGPTAAAEPTAQLENDPEDQRTKQREAEEAERQAGVRELTRAEQPIVADLRSAGLEVNSVWNMGNNGRPNPAAIPVLLKHLQIGGYPDRVMAMLGHQLAMKEANFAWDTLREHYLKARGPAEQEGLAAALAESATSAQLDALIDLMGEDSRDDSRLLLLRAIKRVGRRGGRGREVLESFRDDPMFGKQAQLLLKTRRRPGAAGTNR